MRIAFDIGGVLSKYPDILRPLALLLQHAGVDVLVITDMHDHAAVVGVLALNGFEFIPPANVFTADYDKHGEGCKAELLKELRVDVFLDDFIGYVVPGGAPVRLLVMPDASRPYYHESWKMPDGEATFGRRTYQRKA